MTFVQRASSVRIISCISFGVLLAGSRPMPSTCLTNSAFATALFISALIRVTIGETKSFQQVRKNNHVVRLPFADVFRQQSREVFLVAGTLTILFASFYLGVSYLTAFGTGTLGLSSSTVLTANLVAGLVFAAATIVLAIWSDRVGRRRLIIAGNLFSTGWAVVVFQIIGSVAPSATVSR